VKLSLLEWLEFEESSKVHCEIQVEVPFPKGQALILSALDADDPPL